VAVKMEDDSVLDVAALYTSFIMSYQQIHSLSACLNILPRIWSLLRFY